MATYKQSTNYELVILTGISFLCNDKKFASENGVFRFIAEFNDILQCFKDKEIILKSPKD